MEQDSLVQHKKDQVKMIGMDFGSTTSSAMVAVAGVGLNSITGRMAFSDPEVVYRSQVEFTPFKDGEIDATAIAKLLDSWLEQDQNLFSGGVIITGLAALRSNADHIAKLVKERIGEAVIATVDDPNLESWLAFMGCSTLLSRHYSDRTLVNLDIGGGTTNPAAGVNGHVKTTGCFYIGARHFQFKPGTYCLINISDYGRAILNQLGSDALLGEELEPTTVDQILDIYVEALKAIANGQQAYFSNFLGEQLCQTPFILPENNQTPLITFSGGVGELIYQITAGEVVPNTTYYGDLGVDLALRLIADPFFSSHINSLRPENMGRATVYGLTLHNTEISGSTLFIPDYTALPLNDVPIVARLSMTCDMEEILNAISVVGARSGKACIQMVSSKTQENESPIPATLEEIKTLGLRIGDALNTLTSDLPLVILVPGNFGKALGNYATGWGKSMHKLMIIDEIPDRNAQFVNVGSSYRGVVPVSFYGIY
ncbi:ethanolamine ammonia-lyase reactivating factor EutA [Vibrio sp. WJH972]